MPLPLIPIALTGLSALGGLFGNRGNRGGVSKEFGPLQQLLLDRTMARLRRPTGANSPVETAGIEDINSTFNAGQQGLEGMLTARGLSTSPVAGNAIAGLQGRRLAEISRFRRDLPRQLELEDFDMATRLLGLGYGGGQGGGAAGGAIGSAASMLGFLYGMGAFGGGGGGG